MVKAGVHHKSLIPPCSLADNKDKQEQKKPTSALIDLTKGNKSQFSFIALSNIIIVIDNDIDDPGKKLLQTF